MGQTMSGVSLDELLKEEGVAPSQLDYTCSREHLQDIALFLESWRTVVPHLGLSKADVEEVERDGMEEKEKKQKVLESWYAKFAFKAKYRVLIEALLKIGRADQAVKVCCLLRVSQHSKEDQHTPLPEPAPPTPPPSKPPRQPITEGAGSPELLPSVRRLPYQPLTNHCEAQSLSLKEEIKQFEENYEDLVDYVLSAFKTGGVSLKRVLKCLRQLPVSMKLQCVQFLQGQAARLSQVSSFDELFIILSQHWDFLNPSLLAHLAYRFGDEQTKRSVDEYLRELREFRMRTTINNIIDKWTGTLLPDTQELVMELGENWREQSLEQLEELRIEVSRKRWFGDYVMPLKGIRESSVDAVFSLPGSVDIHTLELESLRGFLYEHQVVRILLNGACILSLQLEQSLAEEISVLKQRIEELEQKLSSEILLPGATRSSLSLLLAGSDKVEVKDQQIKTEVTETDVQHVQPGSTALQQDYLRGVEVIGHTSFIYNGSAQSFEWIGYGFKMHLPENALPPGAEICEIHVKASLSGQFQFPERMELVSGIYWISAPYKFAKPITIEIQHCSAREEHAQHLLSLTYVVAECTQDDLPYNFKILNGGVFSPSSRYGSINLTQSTGLGITSLLRLTSLMQWLPSLVQWPPVKSYCA